MNIRHNLIRFSLSALSVAASLAIFSQFVPAVASAQTSTSTPTCPAGWTCTSATSTVATLSLDGSSPLTSTVGVTNLTQGQYLGLPVLVFDVSAPSSNLHLHTIAVNINTSGPGTVAAAYLWQGSTPIASAAIVNGVATFSPISDNQVGATIPAGTTVPFTVKVDVSGLVAQGSQETVSASVSPANVTIYNPSDSTVAVTGTANGNKMTVVGPGPVFSVASTPTLIQQNITPGGASTTTIQYVATFNVNVINLGSSPISLGLPSSQNPAFASPSAGQSSSNMIIYKNGVSDNANIANYHLIASYSQPTNTTLSSDGKSFILAQNQSVQIPVNYVWALQNPGASVYGLQLTGAVYSNTNSNPVTYMTAPLIGACTANSGAGCAPITSPVIPTITEISAPASNASEVYAGENFAIEGTNFSAPDSVYVGNEQATVTQEAVGIGPQVLQATAPSDLVSGPSYVYVSNRYGTSSHYDVTVFGTATTTPIVIAPSARMYAPTTLALTYNSQKQESLLTGTYEVGISGGTQGVNVYKNNAGGTFYNNANGSQAFANSQTVVSFAPVNSSPSVVTDNFGQQMYAVPPGQLVVFKEIVTTNPQQLFAGTYYAGMFGVYANPGTSAYNGYYMNVPVVKSNLVTIVGEVSPYITSVNSPVAAGQTVIITGQRLGGSIPYIDSAPIPNSTVVANVNGTSLSFTLPSTFAAGSHLVSVANSTTGASNAVTLVTTVGVSTTTPPANKPPVISGGTYPTSLIVGQTGTWTVYASDPQNGSLSYTINWGDQTPAQALQAKTNATAVAQSSSFTHAYANPGNYTVVINVTDSVGLSAKTSTTVNVVAPVSNPIGSSGNYVPTTVATSSSGNYVPTSVLSSKNTTANAFSGFLDFLRNLF